MITWFFALTTLAFQYGAIGEDVASSRLAVVGVHGKGENDYLLSFHLHNGNYRWALFQRKGESNPSVEWNNLSLPDHLTGVSNPVFVPTGNTSLICVQASNGQVYCITVLPSLTPVFDKWVLVGTELPKDKDVTLKSMDTINLKFVAGQPYIYARSLAKESNLYWSARNEHGNWSAWQQIGSSSVSLLTDAAVQYNQFSKLYEAYAVMNDGYMYRAWQTSFSKWVGWTKTGYFAPKSQHAPVAHSMSSNFFNGFTNVFIHGADGYLHHIWQTTCDKVPNPWGWCTWSTWRKIGIKIPSTKPVMNTLAAGNNIHLGIELFTTSTDGKVFYLWQAARDSKWHGWQAVKGSESSFTNLPLITDDFTGWWTAYGLNAEDSIVTVHQQRTLSVSPRQIKYGDPVEVAWSVPEDQATHLDWIGVYPHGDNNRLYVDYYYVGGNQNPYKDAVPTGKLTLKSYLPAGMYDYRYLVNRRYVEAVGASLQVISGSHEEEWVQVFRGLFTGLKIANVSVKECVKDAETVVTAYKKSFAFFEDREIYKGLNYFGFALKDTLAAAEACGIVPTVVQGIEKLVKDLIACVKGDCKNFLIDSLKEILILYENIYEIYGDIAGAKNSFAIKAYEQGGYCVGRVVHACVTLRDRSPNLFGR